MLNHLDHPDMPRALQHLLARTQPHTAAATMPRRSFLKLAGVGGLAGHLILVDRPALIETANRLGLFVWGETRP